MTAGGIVYLVGAGPGDAGLITVYGLELIKSAEVIVADRLVGRELLCVAQPDAKLIDVGKSRGGGGPSQDRINRILIEHARRKRRVVRLKGGDPFVFGRGYEELAACRAANVRCEVVPGVSSAIAGPSAMGVPLTHRGEARSFAVVTGETAGGSVAQAATTGGIDFNALARIDTVVLLMGGRSLEAVCSSLVSAGRSPRTPVAAIASATTGGQRHVTGTLVTVGRAVRAAELKPPVVTVIGPTARYAKAPPGRGSAVLRGRRIVVTRPESTSDNLRNQLLRAGATVINLPLFSIRYPRRNPRLDAAIASLDDYDWIVFTSVHGVQAFWRRLMDMGLDSRGLGTVRVAAVGPQTAAALQRVGIVADLIPVVATGAALAKELQGVFKNPGVCVLHPRSALADGRFARTLRKHGAVVNDVVAYRHAARRVDAQIVESIESGVDAILFFSPSAVRRFKRLNVARNRTRIFCIGPVTEAAARGAGYAGIVQANPHTTAGMIRALKSYFAKRSRKR